MSWDLNGNAECGMVYEGHRAGSPVRRVRGRLVRRGAVASSLVSGVEAGLYHLPSPDVVLNWMVSSRAGVSPRAYPFVESCLLPLASLIEAAASVYFRRKLFKRACVNRRGR